MNDPTLSKGKIQDHGEQRDFDQLKNRRDEMALMTGPGGVGDLNSGRLPSSMVQHKRPANQSRQQALVAAAGAGIPNSSIGRSDKVQDLAPLSTNSLQINQPGLASPGPYLPNSHEGHPSSKSKLPFSSASLSGQAWPSGGPPGPIGARSRQ